MTPTDPKATLSSQRLQLRNSIAIWHSEFANDEIYADWSQGFSICRLYVSNVLIHSGPT